MKCLNSCLLFICLLSILNNYVVISDSGFNYNSDQMKIIECLLFRGDYTSCSHNIQSKSTTEGVCSNFPTIGSENNALINLNDNINKNNNQAKKPNLIVLSIGHHGFGNQFFQHMYAYNMAAILGAEFKVKKVSHSEQTLIAKKKDVHSDSGSEIVEYFFRSQNFSEYIYTEGYRDSVCEKEPATFPFSPKLTKEKFREIIKDAKENGNTRCIRLLGYFQFISFEFPPYICPPIIHKLWKLNHNIPKQAIGPTRRDVAVYLRCSFYHYVFDDVPYYEHILNRTSFENVWLFQAPECNEVPHKHNFHERYMKVYTLLTDVYKAKVVRTIDGEPLVPLPSSLYKSSSSDNGNSKFSLSSDAHGSLQDLGTMCKAGKIILSASTWAFVTAMICGDTSSYTNEITSTTNENGITNATEFHVGWHDHNGGWSTLYPDDTASIKYVYHDAKSRQFFGHKVKGTSRIVFDS